MAKYHSAGEAANFLELAEFRKYFTCEVLLPAREWRRGCDERVRAGMEGRG
jgi:hypothetical protein